MNAKVKINLPNQCCGTEAKAAWSRIFLVKPELKRTCGSSYGSGFYTLLEVNKGITGHEPYSRKMMKYGL
jgi:hypothetical protein